MKKTFIYDDTTEATKKFTKWYENNYLTALARTPKEYSWGMNRHNVSSVKKTLQEMLSKDKTGFVITDRVEHAHNIGNNNSFEVEYTKDGTTIIIGRLNLNSDMYGGILSSVTDLEGKKLNSDPKLPRAKKVTTTIYKTMWWPGHDNVVVHRHGAFWKSFSSNMAFIRYIEASNGTATKRGDRQTAITGCYVQEWDVTMKEILDF